MTKQSHHCRAPKDAAWISLHKNLSFSCFNEISLLFRSSDLLIHDLCNSYDSCTDKISSRPSIFVLALRKWYPSLKPEKEFRCFVKSKLEFASGECGYTLRLMYTWEELEEIHGECNALEFRMVESCGCVIPGLKTTVPYDYLDVSSGSGWDQVLNKVEEYFQNENQRSDEAA